MGEGTAFAHQCSVPGTNEGRTATPPRLPARIARRAEIIDRVAVQVALDPYLSLTALARYGWLSIRKLRAHLTDVAHPLPCYRVGGRILVRRSEFDAWMVAFRRRGRHDVDRLVAEVLREMGGRVDASPTSLDKGPAG